MNAPPHRSHGSGHTVAPTAPATPPLPVKVALMNKR